MECEQSSRSTVAQEDWYSHWCTWRSEYSMFSGSLALALNGPGERGGDVEIKRVAKFIEPGRAAGFDAGGKITRVMASEARFPQRSHQIAQGLVTEKVQTLVRDFEFGLLLGFAHLPADA